MSSSSSSSAAATEAPPQTPPSDTASTASTTLSILSQRISQFFDTAAASWIVFSTKRIDIHRSTWGILHDGTDVWKLALAIVALVEFKAGCWSVVRNAWLQAAYGVEQFETYKYNHKYNTIFDHDENKCQASHPDNEDSVCYNSSYFYYHYDPRNIHWETWIGSLFCVMCLYEAIRRAKEARQHVLELQALSEFERQLATMYGGTHRGNNNNNNTSTNTLLLIPPPLQEQTEQSQQQQQQQQQEQQQLTAAQIRVRLWLPVMATLLFWGLLMPWKTMVLPFQQTQQQQQQTTTTASSSSCGKDSDTAIMTYWIQRSLRQTTATLALVHATVLHRMWKILMPFKFWQTRAFVKRLKLLLRWVRYLRFSGPLGRILFKVNDQLMLLFRSRTQHWQAQTEKLKRVRRRSMLFEDLRRMESLVKLQTRLAKVPSQMLLFPQSYWSTKNDSQNNNGDNHNNHNNHNTTTLHEKKQQGIQWKARLKQLKAQVRRSSQVFPTTELYDRVAALSQEVTTTVHDQGKMWWNSYLISPQTRFSVGWRVIVTLALLSEVYRISTSYQLYGRVDVSFTNMMKAVLGCGGTASSNTGGKALLTAYGRWTRKLVHKVLRIQNDENELTSCKMTSHTVSHILLKLTGAFETSVDIVCFLDIFVWFFTGELDVSNATGGVVVVRPKPFFYRCIIPGTLVQVLDHPTLPHVLPNLLSYSFAAADAVGYSRILRWILAIRPAVEMLIAANPLQKFLFRPMQDEEWLRYTQSLAILPGISGADIRYSLAGGGAKSHNNLRDASALSLAGAKSHGNLSTSALNKAKTSFSAMKRSDASLGSFPFSNSNNSLREMPMPNKMTSFPSRRVRLDSSSHDIDSNSNNNNISNHDNDSDYGNDFDMKRSTSGWTLHPLDESMNESYRFSFGNLNY